MISETTLKKLDELVDDGIAIGIELGRVDEQLAQRLHDHLLAWRAFVTEELAIPDDGLATFKRHLTRKGE